MNKAERIMFLFTKIDSLSKRMYGLSVKILKDKESTYLIMS